MPNNEGSIKCPYYITSGAKYATCEGIYSEVIKQRFGNEQEINRHQRRMCCNYPNECKIAEMLEEKYRKSKGV